MHKCDFVVYYRHGQRVVRTVETLNIQKLQTVTLNVCGFICVYIMEFEHKEINNQYKIIEVNSTWSVR